MWTECQIILFNFLLIIYHQLPEISKRSHLPYLLPILSLRLLLISLLIWYTVIGGDDLHKYESDDMMLVVVHTKEMGDMIMLMVVPTQVLTSRTEYYLWILFPLSDL